MQVKKFEAQTMQEALKVIKRELGPDAIILSTKHIKSGFGLMSKASVEVTAAIAEKDLKKKKMAEKDLPQDVKEKIWSGKAEKQSEIYDTYFEKQLKRANRDRVEIGGTQRRSQENPANQPLPPSARQSVRDEIVASAAPTRTAVAQRPEPRPSQQPTARQAAPEAPRERRYIDISDEESPAQARASIVNRPAPAAAPNPANMLQGSGAPDKVRSLEADIEQLKSMVVELATGSAGAREETDSELSEALVQTLQDLVSSGIEKKLARQIVRQVSFDLAPEERDNESLIADKIAAQLMEGVQVRDLLENVGAVAGKSKTTTIALVGPTGVGKTTTIAKIASLAILEKRLRVGLINLDSYKVAAADQLATYAKIMNVPFRSVNTREELQQAIFDFSTLDLVLIDTTGRSQKDQESLLQLRHMLASIDGLQSALMISATTKDSDIAEVVTRFRLFNPVGMVFSKLDETSLYGCIYNVHRRSGLPLLYFTVGQRVPEDIEKASAERIVDLVMDL